MIKKIIILLLLITFDSLAGDIKLTYGLNDFDKAKVLYSQKRYSDALEVFENLKNIKAIDPNKLDFYIGRCHYEQGDYEQAKAAYERILINDPQNLRVRLEYAQTLYGLDLIKEAKDEFKYVLTKDIPSKVRENIEKRVESIDAKNKKDIFDFTALFGIMYDSNIQSGNDEASMYIPVLDIEVENQSRIGRPMYEMGLITNHVRKVNENIILENALILYANNYISSRYKNKNIQVASLSIAPSYIKDDYKLSLGLGYDHVWYAQANFLDNLSFAPSLTYKIDKENFVKAGLKYIKKRFIKASDIGLDSNGKEISAELNNLTKERGLLKVGIVMGNESALNNDRYDVNKKYYSLHLSNSYELKSDLVLNSMLGIKRTKYDDYDIFFQTYRKDWKYDASIGLMYMYDRSTVLGVNYLYINQLSNVQPYDYSKHVLKATVTYKF